MRVRHAVAKGTARNADANVQSQIRVSPKGGSYETSSQTTDARNKGSKTTM